MGIRIQVREILFLGVLAAALLAVAPGIAAQEVRVRSSMNTEMAYVGDIVPLTVEIEGTNVESVDTDVPEVPGLRIDGPYGPNRNSMTTILNGRVTERVTTTYQYRVTTLREGRYEIPVFKVTVNGAAHRAGPHRLEVTKPPEDSRIELKASLNKTSCYPREPVVLSYTLRFAKPIRDHLFSIPLLENASDLHPSIVPPAKGERRQDTSIRGFRGTFPAQRGTETIDGRGYQTWTLRIRFHPDAPGRFEIPPAAVVAEVVLGEKTQVQRDWFGVRRRVPVAEVTTLRASTEPMTLEVKDFPPEGRVDGFYGLVGDFTVTVEADRTRAKVGDPILLRIRVRGDGILDTVERPILSRVEEFAGFKVDDNLAPGERDDNSILFEQKIRPRSADVTEIPPVPLPYFNFVAGDYAVARSEPISIDVLPTDVVTAGDIEGRGGAIQPYVEKSELEEKSGGLNSNYLYLDALEDRRIEVARIAWVFAAPVGYLLVAAAMAMRRSRRADVAGSRARGARKLALKEIDRVESSGSGASDREFHESLSRAVHRFFTDRFALGEGEITSVEIERLCEEGRIPGPIGEETIRILEACAAGRFGAGGNAGGAREELLSRIRRMIREVAS